MINIEIFTARSGDHRRAIRSSNKLRRAGVIFDTAEIDEINRLAYVNHPRFSNDNKITFERKVISPKK